MKIQITRKKVVLLYVIWNFHVLKNLNLIFTGVELIIILFIRPITILYTPSGKSVMSILLSKVAGMTTCPKELYIIAFIFIGD